MKADSNISYKEPNANSQTNKKEFTSPILQVYLKGIWEHFDYNEMDTGQQ